MTTTYFTRERYSVYRRGYEHGQQDALMSAPKGEDMESGQTDYVEGYNDGFEGRPRATLAVPTSE